MTSHRGQGAFGPLSENPTPVNAVSSTQEDAVIDGQNDVVDEIGSLSIASATQNEQAQEQAQTEYGLQESQVPWPAGKTL